MIKLSVGNDEMVNRVRDVPIDALSGDFCGLACEVCPLRPWKVGSYCTVILEQHRLHVALQLAQSLAQEECGNAVHKSKASISEAQVKQLSLFDPSDNTGTKR